jgi:hypothetical protein
MTAAVFILLGLFLCFLGARSIRFAVLVAGFLGAWLVADAFDADRGTTLLVAAAAAAGALVLSILLARFALFAAGLVVGGAIGAKLFEIVADSGTSRLLALVFVPAVAVLCGFLAERMRKPFLVWATAFAGAAMVLTGVGRIDTGPTHQVRQPDDPGVGLLIAVLWVGLALLGQAVQARRLAGKG